MKLNKKYFTLILFAFFFNLFLLGAEEAVYIQILNANQNVQQVLDKSDMHERYCQIYIPTLWRKTSQGVENHMSFKVDEKESEFWLEIHPFEYNLPLAAYLFIETRLNEKDLIRPLKQKEEIWQDKKNIKISYVHQKDDKEFHVMHKLFVVKEKLYILTFSALRKRYAMHLDQVREVFASFSVQDSSQNIREDAEYVNHNYKFSFKFPADWARELVKKQDNVKKAYLYFEPETPISLYMEPEVTIEVFIDSIGRINEPSKVVMGYIKTLEKEMKKIFNSFEKISQLSSDIDDCLAMETIYEVDFQGETLKEKHYVFADGENVYFVVYKAPKNKFSLYYKNFEKMMRTFKFEK